MVQGWAKYTKVRTIGTGSHGAAILARCIETQQEYIIKTIDLSKMTPKQRNDAVNEVKVLSACRHPYIVNYKESFFERHHLCIVMDFATGGDMSKLIARQRKLGRRISESQILRWITQLVLAVRYMHERHIMHRDIKPQNLFITDRGRLKVGDFGIARVMENTLAFAKTRVGTPLYLSPEICSGSAYTLASDIWCIGCVLFELTSLRLPFPAADFQSLVVKILNEPVPEINSYYSEDLRNLCYRMMHKNWRQRPTADEISRDPLIQSIIQRMLEDEKKSRGLETISASATPPLSRIVSPPHCPCPAVKDCVTETPSQGGEADVRDATPTRPVAKTSEEKSTNRRTARFSPIPTECLIPDYPKSAPPGKPESPCQRGRFRKFSSIFRRNPLGVDPIQRPLSSKSSLRVV